MTPGRGLMARLTALGDLDLQEENTKGIFEAQVRFRVSLKLSEFKNNNCTSSKFLPFLQKKKKKRTNVKTKSKRKEYQKEVAE